MTKLKMIILLTSLFFCWSGVASNPLFSQEDVFHKTLIGYGSGLFLSSKGYTNNISIQRTFIQNAKWSLGVELLGVLGGPWALNYVPEDLLETEDATSVYRFLTFSVGGNLYKPLVKKPKIEYGISIGFLMGYENYQESRTLQSTPVSGGASVVGIIDKKEGVSKIIPLKLTITKRLKETCVSLSPAWYYMGKKKSNLALFLNISF